MKKIRKIGKKIKNENEINEKTKNLKRKILKN